MTTITGLGLLLLTLAALSFLSIKAPKGSAAIPGMANAAVAIFPMEAVHRYIPGDLLHLASLGETSTISGDMGGVTVTIMAPIGMGVSPVFAVVAGVALGGYGIPPGFIVRYVVGFIVPFVEKHLSPGLDSVLRALLIAPIARLAAFLVDPAVNAALARTDGVTTATTEQSPILMRFLLGGVIKVICMSPLSSTALTAMLRLTGLPMGIAVITCFGGSFTNGIILKAPHFGDSSNVAVVTMELLTQAHITTEHPIPIYCPDFLGGGLSGMAAAFLSIVNSAPEIVSPIPGLLMPSALNPPLKVPTALLLAAISGTLAGIMGAIVFKKRYGMKPELSVISLFKE